MNKLVKIGFLILVGTSSAQATEGREGRLLGSFEAGFKLQDSKPFLPVNFTVTKEIPLYERINPAKSRSERIISRPSFLMTHIFFQNGLIKEQIWERVPGYEPHPEDRTILHKLLSHEQSPVCALTVITPFGVSQNLQPNSKVTIHFEGGSPVRVNLSNGIIGGGWATVFYSHLYDMEVQDDDSNDAQRVRGLACWSKSNHAMRVSDLERTVGEYLKINTPEDGKMEYVPYPFRTN